MGSRNRVLSNDSSVIFASLSDALLFTTMCIIGLPVEVHIKDGSVYSGIFYTASARNGYDIEARKIAAGDTEAIGGIHCPKSKPKIINLVNCKEGNEPVNKTSFLSNSKTYELVIAIFVKTVVRLILITELLKTRNGLKGRKMVRQNFGTAHEVQNGKLDGHSRKREGSVATSANGRLGNRTQPVRHPVQGGPAFVHPNSQNIMVGRFGQLVYMHPFAHDVVQGAHALSQASAQPELSPHQSPFLKHQSKFSMYEVVILLIDVLDTNSHRKCKISIYVQGLMFEGTG
ncbi:Ataxin 2, SM domain [Dillenia turbinata]|uniref:Ataxin 2, SM domain n=1 Tax=Dillenia turbinata TaxID=194707 RepID=A0AAN8W6N5_9MAGN